VAFSPDNRQIVSSSRDRTIKLWNTLGDCKFTFSDEGRHTDWVSCVRFSPNPSRSPTIVSAGHDNLVKVWDLQYCKLLGDLVGHKGHVNSVAISPDGTLCASGGRDGAVMLWDLNDRRFLHQLEGNENIESLCFSPIRYWLCVATNKCVKVWDLENKEVMANIIPPFPGRFDEAGKERKKFIPPHCVSVAWSPDSLALYTGWTDNAIRIYTVSQTASMSATASVGAPASGGVAPGTTGAIPVPSVGSILTSALHTAAAAAAAATAATSSSIVGGSAATATTASATVTSGAPK